MVELVYETIAENIEDTIKDIINRFDEDTDREELIKDMDVSTDNLWSNLVKRGRIDEYDSNDLVATSSACAEIISYAEKHAWVGDDWGLWEGLTYGVLASIAYFSLHNVLYQALADKGVDCNDDYPFAK